MILFCVACKEPVADEEARVRDDRVFCEGCFLKVDKLASYWKLPDGYAKATGAFPGAQMAVLRTCERCSQEAPCLNGMPWRDYTAKSVSYCAPCWDADREEYMARKGYRDEGARFFLEITLSQMEFELLSGEDLMSFAVYNKRRVSTTEAIDDLLGEINAEEKPLCKRAYYGIDCSCPKCLARK